MLGIFMWINGRNTLHGEVTPYGTIRLDDAKKPAFWAEITLTEQEAADIVQRLRVIRKLRQAEAFEVRPIPDTASERLEYRQQLIEVVAMLQSTDDLELVDIWKRLSERLRTYPFCGEQGDNE
jgi:hypothetical protein